MRKALVVIDMQNDFISGSLGTPEAQAIVERAAGKIAENRGKVLLLCTRDTHGSNYLSTQEGRRLPVVHCVADSEGWALDARIAQALGPNAVCFDKSTFGSAEMALYLTSIPGLEEIELIGLCTDICVISNALLLKAFLPEVRIVVDASCCAGVSPQGHQNALEAMRVCQVDIVRA